MLNFLKTKWLTLILIIIALAAIYYFFIRTDKINTEVTYITTPVTRGTLAITIGGSGQVASGNQVEIKPQVAGTVSYVNVKNGQEVKSGALLFQIDAKEAIKSVRDAEANLDSAKLSLEKLLKPADALSIIQAENSLAQSQESKIKTASAITKGYDDAFSAVANSFLDSPTIISELYNMLYATTIADSDYSVGRGTWNYNALLNTLSNSDNRLDLEKYTTKARTDYESVRALYDTNFDKYKTAGRYDNTEEIESLLTDTLKTIRSLAEAAKSASNMFDVWVDYRSQENNKTISAITAYQSKLSDYIGKTNNHLSTLLNQQTSLTDNKQALINADRSIKEKTESLAKLKAGIDILDLKTQQLTIKQRENSLRDAQEKLADYYVRAPFTGVIAKLDIKRGDQASSGTSPITLITQNKIAEISLNEVDVAKVKIGQKVTLTFDAIDNLTLTGQVAEIDSLGTTTQGVVYYAVKISFDTQDERIKPSMSVSANIITEARPDILIVPSSAIKTSNNGQNYVEILVNNTPESKNVTVGISNDTNTEITEGLSENESIITQTIQPSANSTQTPARSGNSLIPGLGGGGQIRGVR